MNQRQLSGPTALQRVAISAARFTACASLAFALAACGGGGDDGSTETRVVPKAFADVTDSSHATVRVANILTGFFEAKSLHRAAEMVTFFAPRPDPVMYFDAGLGLAPASQDALLELWSGPLFSGGPPTALSYPLRVIGNEHSAVIEFVDTPDLLGLEFRFLSSLTFDANGKIIRWVDYWDGRSSKLRVPLGTWAPYPTDFRDNINNASPKIQQVAQALQSALQVGDAAAAASLFTPDALFEDRPLHTLLAGKEQIQRYFERGITQLPYGSGATLAHIDGSDQGGGYEWHASPSAAPLLRGITGLELDVTGKITRFTTMYDSYEFTNEKYDALVQLAAEPPVSSPL